MDTVDPLPDALLDATGLICPLPVLRTRKALRAMEPGAVLMVRTTDPAALRDMPAFCMATDNDLLGVEEQNGVATFRIRRALTPSVRPELQATEAQAARRPPKPGSTS